MDVRVFTVKPFRAGQRIGELRSCHDDALVVFARRGCLVIGEWDAPWCVVGF